MADWAVFFENKVLDCGIIWRSLGRLLRSWWCDKFDGWGAKLPASRERWSVLHLRNRGIWRPLRLPNLTEPSSHQRWSLEMRRWQPTLTPFTHSQPHACVHDRNHDSDHNHHQHNDACSHDVKWKSASSCHLTTNWWRISTVGLACRVKLLGRPWSCQFARCQSFDWHIQCWRMSTEVRNESTLRSCSDCSTRGYAQEALLPPHESSDIRVPQLCRLRCLGNPKDTINCNNNFRSNNHDSDHNHHQHNDACSHDVKWKSASSCHLTTNWWRISTVGLACRDKLLGRPWSCQFARCQSFDWHIQCWRMSTEVRNESTLRSCSDCSARGYAQEALLPSHESSDIRVPQPCRLRCLGNPKDTINCNNNFRSNNHDHDHNHYQHNDACSHNHNGYNNDKRKLHFPRCGSVSLEMYLVCGKLFIFLVFCHTSHLFASSWGDFEPIDGGVDRACRGASSTDNNPSHYVVQNGIADLDGCKAICIIDALCQGRSVQKAQLFQGSTQTQDIAYNDIWGRMHIWLHEIEIKGNNYNTIYSNKIKHNVIYLILYLIF